MHSKLAGAGHWLSRVLVMGSLLVGPACQPSHEATERASAPPVGHYEGSISITGQPELRAALDIRHPRTGHYEAEFTVPALGTLNFVADTILFSNNQLHLTRPARPGQKLHLTLEGDFWRGTLALDSTTAPAILVKRGAPAPSAYHVAEVPQVPGRAWLFSPSDTGTPGAALALLPNTKTDPAAALWADALAREGIIVLVLPATITTNSTAVTANASRWRGALRLLNSTAGADTANLGVWATGAQATALVQALATPTGPRVAFAIAQNMEPDPTSRPALRALRNRKISLLGLYGGPMATQRAATLRRALGGRRGGTVLAFRSSGANLLARSGFGVGFGPGLPGGVVEWLRGKAK